MIKIITDAAEVRALRNRDIESYGNYAETVRAILADVAARGDEAVLEYGRRFDCPELDRLEVTEGEIDEAIASLDPEIVATIRRSADNIAAYHKKQLREGTATVEGYQEGMNQMFKAKKAPVIISIVAIALILLALIPLMFMGTVETVVGDDALTVKATFWEDLTVAYDEIDGMEYREEGVDGSRVAGYGSAKLLLGGFQNDEFGSYTRYTYTGDGPCIVLTVGKRTIVIGTENAETTADLYEQLGQKLIESVE